MAVRPAEARDVPEILVMFAKLLAYLEGAGNDLYTKNKNQFTGGVIKLLGAKMSQPGGIVLVTTDAQDEATGFLIGWLIEYPEFFEDYRLGEIQWMFPLSFSSQEMLKTFDQWAQSHGATARACYATPTHEKSLKIFERNGLRLGLQHYFKKYNREG